MFELLLDGFDGAIDVASFRGREAVGRAARLDVDVVLDAPPREVDETFLGRGAVLVLDRDRPGARRIAGAVCRVQWLGTLSHGAQRFRLRIASRIARLGLTRRSRIFQDTRADAVIDGTLGLHRLARRFALREHLEDRAYCVQYRETDLDFVRRLLAEEGLFFFLEDPGADGLEETIVIADDTPAYLPVPGEPLVVREPADGLAPEEHHVRRVAHGRRAVHDGARLQSYDPEKPSRGASSEQQSPAGLGLFSGGVLGEHDEDLSPGGPARPTTTPWPRAATLLDQARRKERITTGETPCVRLFPGGVIEIREHDASTFDGPYVVKSIVHEGVDPRAAGGREPYIARFEAVPAGRRLRSRPAPRRLVQVAETARVVGPPGASEGEVHTDRMGRVEVQFPWDTDPRPNSRSSCWIRAVQAWAGNGFGSQFLPRVGMEVLVVFLGGDPDRPVVVGALPNAEHLPPYALPMGAGTSGFRTQTLGGTGYNELAFSDAPGAEMVRLRGEKDMELSTEGALTTRSADRRSDVTCGDRLTHVYGEDRVTVERDRTTEIQGEDAVSVLGGVDVSVGEGIRAAAASGIHIETGGGLSAQSDGPFVVDAGTDISLRSGPGTGVLQLSAGGALFAQANRDLTIHAGDRITLVVGATRVEITPEGLTVKAGDIKLEASQSLAAIGPGPSMTLGEDARIVAQKISLLSEEAEVTLTKEAEIKGSKIKLGGQKKDEKKDQAKDEEEKKPFAVVVTDYDLEPYADKHFEIVAHGERIEGETSVDGEVTADVPAETKVIDLKVWIDLYPEGRVRQWMIAMGDLEDVGSAKGALERLRNLGYHAGAIGEELGPEGVAALKWFQRDHGLEATGEMDSDTKAKLEEIHGA